jgi:glycosyltransferase involved in cell wall biosynthesis
MIQDIKLPTIYFILDSFLPNRDGNVVAALNLIDALTKQGYDCYVITPKNHIKTDVTPYKVIYNRSLLQLGKYPLSMRRISRAVRKHILSQEQAIIHFHSNFSLSRGMMKFATKHHIPTIVTIHTRYYLDFKNTFKSKLLATLLTKSIVKRFYNKADKLISVSEGAIEELKPFGLKRDDYLIVRNIASFTGVIKEEDLNKFKSLRNSENIFLFVGHLAFVKNLLFLIDVFKKLHDQGFPYQLLLAGEGIDEMAIMNYAKKQKINALFLKQLTKDELASVYSLSDLLVFFSVFDTYGLTIDEAATFHLPALVAKGGDPSRRITDNVNGFVVDLDVETAAKRITDIFNDKALLNKVKSQTASLLKNQKTIVAEEIRIINELIKKAT